MAKYLLLLGILTGLSGMVVSVISLRERTSEAPSFLFLHPLHWFGLRQKRKWFSAGGYRLYVSGGLLMSGGALLILLGLLIPQ